MNRAQLTLLACPALLASTLLAHSPVSAEEIVAQPTNTATTAPTKPAFEVVFERPTSDPSPEANEVSATDDCSCSGDPALNFTDQESSAAIERFGCDCAGCLNALRQLQGKPPLL